jgi:hypothetical protein
MSTDKSSSSSVSYRSPVAKLLRFFRLSRDKWKEKCKAAKRENKSLKTRLRKMRESRDRWRARARDSVIEARTECPPARGRKNGAHHPERSGERVA